MKQKKKIMNILLITNSLGYGGVEKNIKLISEFLIHAKQNVFVLNLNTIGAYDEFTQALNQNVTVIRVY